MSAFENFDLLQTCFIDKYANKRHIYVFKLVKTKKKQTNLKTKHNKPKPKSFDGKMNLIKWMAGHSCVIQSVNHVAIHSAQENVITHRWKYETLLV